MKKMMLIASLTLGLISCGGGEKKAETATDTPKPESMVEKPADDLSSNPDYTAGMEVVTKPENLCLTCHKIDEKLTGPAYRDVANKYENNEETIAKLAKKVKEGGVGVWGDIPMPPNATISIEDARKAVKYVLLLKSK